MNCAKCGKELYFWLGHPLFHYWEGTPSKIERGFCGPVCSLRYFQHQEAMELVTSRMPVIEQGLAYLKDK